MKQSIASALLTISIAFISTPPVNAAPGNLSPIPLFVATPTPPNIFFMLDDSGSMNWAMPTDGVSSYALIEFWQYDTMPDNQKEWNAWCLGANFLAYDPNITYKPWFGINPNTNNPFPDQTDIKHVWVDPLKAGSTIGFKSGENNIVRGYDNAIIDLSAAPVIQWTDTDNDGQYDNGECPTGNSITGYLDSRVQRADQLSAEQQTNFANWFSYYRTREHTTKAAVTQVIANTSARMGMATLHHNNGVGAAIKDMSNASNKSALIENIVKIRSSGGTPLRSRLNWVGEYFNGSAPSGLNIGRPPNPILSAADGGECQQNFVMLMTDGQWNGSFSSVGHQDKVVDNLFVFEAHKDLVKNTLADVAMKWYKTDLASSLANKVPIQSGPNTINLDENDAQHLVTFGVAFGPTGTLSAGPTDRTASFTWPTPTSNSNKTVDDLRHASYNGRGKFLSANNPQTLITALQDVIADIESRQGSAAAAAFNATSLSSSSILYFASFDTTNWTGELEAFSLDPNTGDLALSSNWQASAVLDSKSNTAMASRTIYTWGTDSSANKNGVLFNWRLTDPQPKSSIIDDIKINPDTSSESSPYTESQKRLDFLRGDLSYDNTGLFRNRSSRLGDIIHSAPLFVGEPDSGWPDNTPFGDAAYSTFQSDLQASPRDSIVYIAANDGMLHGFNSTNGEEVIAYLPSTPASVNDKEGFHYLTEADYNHRYYVDGSPISADIYIDPNSSGTQSWRTVLIGSLRGGGQGIYALDVTDPTQFQNTQSAASNIVLWEFTNQDDSDLGYTYSDPQIAMMNNNEWALVFGNGYNATGTDKAKLFILFIEKGVDGQWTINTDYIKIDTGVGNSSSKNGLSSPTLVDLDGNGTTDRIYAGDILGNLWAFDVSDSNKSNWTIAHKNNSNVAEPLFSAGSTKPITMKPLVIENDWVANIGNSPNLMIYFGTGQYISIGDASTTDQQSFYGLWDTGESISSGTLVEQTLLPGIPSNARVLSDNPVNFAAPPSLGDFGWFINLPESGERVIVDAFELQGLIFFNTMTPSATPCSAGGDSWLMAANKKNGGNPDLIAFDYNLDTDLTDDDKVTDASNVKQYVAGIKFGFGIASRTATIKTNTGKSFGYISGTNSTKPIKTPLPGGLATGERKSWIQLFND